MQAISDRSRELIYSGDADYDINLTIGGEVISEDNIISIKIDTPIIDKESKYMYIGTFIANKLEIQFKKPLNIDLSQSVSLSVSIKDYQTGEVLDLVPYGVFFIDTQEKDYYDNAKLICYDGSVKLKTSFDAEPYFNHDEQGVATNINIVTLLNSICEYYKIELGDYPNVNNDIMISAYDSTLSGKAYVSYIAELMGGNAKFGRDNKLYIRPAKSEAAIDINYTDGSEWVIGEKYEITRVVYDNGVLVPSKFGNEEGNTLYIRNDNILISGSDTYRNNIVENIYNSVNGLVLHSVKCKNVVDISLDCYDLVNYVDGENNYQTYYNVSFELLHQGVNEIKLPSILQEDTTNINDNSSVETKIRTVKTYVDTENAELRTEITNTKQDISDIGTEITNINKVIQTLGDTYTKTEIQQIITGVGVDGVVVTSTITETGTFDKDGLTIDNSSSESGYKGNFNENGMKVIEKSTDETVLYAGVDNKNGETVVISKNLTAQKYLHIGRHSRIQDMTLTQEDFGYSGIATGVFWLGE